MWKEKPEMRTLRLLVFAFLCLLGAFASGWQLGQMRQSINVLTVNQRNLHDSMAKRVDHIRTQEGTIIPLSTLTEDLE